MYRFLWGGIVGLLAISLIFTLKPENFESNIFALLPEQSAYPGQATFPEAAIDQYSEKLSRKVVFLVSASNDKRAIENSRIAYLHLNRSDIFSEIQYRLDEQQLRSLYKSYQDYQFALLSDSDRKGIESNPEDWLADKLLQQLVSPVAGAGSESLKTDPFGLFRDFLAGLPAGSRSAKIIDGYTFFHANNTSYVLISAELKDSAFGQQIQTGFDKLVRELKQNTSLVDNIVVFGVVRYALANRLLAQQEMSTIGVGSLLGIVLIFFLTFRRYLLLGYVLLPVAIGVLSALSINLLLFDQIHLVSLVFGASLIGVSIDYTLHFCCSHSNLTDSRNAVQALGKVKMALTIGLVTSSLGYLTLSVADFPALRQMAALAIAGLAGAYFTVLFWLPVLVRKPLTVQEKVTHWTTSVSNWLRGKKAMPLWLVITLIVVGLTVNNQIKNSQDDIKIMRATIDELESIDERLQGILGEFPNSQFFLVRGTTPDKLLKLERTLIKKLDDVGDERTRVYAMSAWLPDSKSQQQNIRLLRSSILDNRQLNKRISDAGLPVDLIAEYRQQLSAAGDRTMDIESFVNSPAGKLHRDLWIGEVNGHYFSIVRLFGYRNLTVLNKLAEANDNLYFIDRAAQVSSLFEKYRDIIEKMFPFVLLIIFALLSFRFGLAGSFRVVSAPLISALLSFLVTNLIIGQYNLFTIFGLIITVAVAIDYAVFIRESSGDNRSTYLAITLAGLTTVLALGLLSLSHTPALSAFGASLLFGILFSYVLTPLIVKPRSIAT
jgi:predicted exporter